MVFRTFPPEVRGVPGQITSLAHPARQGVTFEGVIVEALPGAIIVKRSTGRHIAALKREWSVLDMLSTCVMPERTPVLFVKHLRGGT